MAVRIRVYPQGGVAGGVGGYGYNALAQTQLRNQRQTSALQLQYERALWQEKIKTVQLQTAMQYGSQGLGAVPVGGYGARAYGLGGLGALGLGGVYGANLGAIPPGFGNAGGLLGGSGQTNHTVQNSTGGNQSVSNANHYSNVVWNQAPAFGGGFPFGGGGYGGGYGNGGFLSSLLGALV